MVHSQIWLHFFWDDGHFGYITKLTPQNKKRKEKKRKEMKQPNGCRRTVGVQQDGFVHDGKVSEHEGTCVGESN